MAMNTFKMAAAGLAMLATSGSLSALAQGTDNKSCPATGDIIGQEILAQQWEASASNKPEEQSFAGDPAALCKVLDANMAQSVLMLERLSQKKGLVLAPE